MGLKSSASPHSKDRRVLRTRRSLRDALIALISERGWDRVSVQDICDRADVGRSTFYTHFTDKEELLVGGLSDLGGLLRRASAASVPAGGQPLGFARGLIDHVHENQRLFRAVIGKHSGHVVQKRFRELVLSLVKEELADRVLVAASRDPTASYIAGGFLELLTWWLKARTPLPPSEIEALLTRLTAPVLAASAENGEPRAWRNGISAQAD